MKRFLLAAILTILLAGTSFAGTVKLTWEYESEGNKGFRLYYGRVSNADVTAPMGAYPNAMPYEQVVEISDPAARMHEIQLPEGTYYFRMTAIGEKVDSVFTQEEPMAKIGVDTPTGFQVEWIFYTREQQ